MPDASQLLNEKAADLPGLMTPSLAYKPFRYPWAYDFWKRQQQVHWMPEEVPLGEDCKDWANKLDDSERNLLTQIFRFFTQSDIEVNDNYMERYARVFKPTEVKMMLSAFSNMETIHVAAYALLLETIRRTWGAARFDRTLARHARDNRFAQVTRADLCRAFDANYWPGFCEQVVLRSLRGEAVEWPLPVRELWAGDAGDAAVGSETDPHRKQVLDETRSDNLTALRDDAPRPPWLSRRSILR